jgi:hypothetical protein
MHDLGAELQGYKDELATVGDDTERAKLIKRQMTGVEAAIKDKAEQLEKQAESLDSTGQDVPAAEARVEARRYRALLDDEPGGEDAAERKPQEKAVPRRSGGGRKS